ncbi:MAG: DUF4190 domain-containing protein [Candidatus Nomurabacteria bacterium]|jgi:ABC-type antimicrobial peptide transport system permease subunit|nr:DUF4190 domain-containing protein [Candidatus Nomurabacteria bacterium]
MVAEKNKSTNTMAILGLIFAFIFPIVGLILSIVAKGQIKKTGEGGSGLATAGLIISIVWMAFIVIWMIVVIAAAGTAITTYNSSSDIYTQLDSLR